MFDLLYREKNQAPLLFILFLEQKNPSLLYSSIFFQATQTKTKTVC